MPISRLGLGGYGVGRTGNFSGKDTGTHPVTVITRLSLDGYGAKRTGSFAGKGGGSGTHPVHRITRLGLDGYGVRRCGSFAGKTPSTTPEPITITNIGGIPEKPRFEFRIRPDIRRDDDEIMAVIIAFLHMVNNQ